MERLNKEINTETIVPVNYTTLVNVAHTRTNLEEIPNHNLPNNNNNNYI